MNIITEECDSIDFKNLLKVIFEYLIHEKHIGDLSRAELDAIITDFSFVRVSQASYNQQI